MANIKSAKKRARQDEVRRTQNLSRRTAIKTAVKKVINALERGVEREEVMRLFNDAQAKFSRAKGKGVVHARTAARKVSRLAKKVSAKFQATTEEKKVSKKA